MFIKVLTQVTILFILIGVGFILTKAKLLSPKGVTSMTDLVLYTVTPCVIVKSFVREDYEKQKFNAAADDVCADFTKAEKLVALNHPIMQNCNLCSNGCSILLGRKAYHKQWRQYYGCGGAFKPVYLRYADSFKPYDGIYDICYDNNIKCFNAAYI